MEALEDDRVHDEASFHAAVAARQRRQEEEARRAEGREAPRRWAQEDGKEYPISTERAQAIVRWVMEAPIGGDVGAARKKKRNANSSSKSKGNTAIEGCLNALKVDDETESFDAVEEEIE